MSLLIFDASISSNPIAAGVKFDPGPFSHHAEVGGMLATAWHFPENLTQAVVDHHAPAAAKADSLANLVHVAELTAHALGLSQHADELVMPLDRTAWERIRGDWLTYRKALPQIEKSFMEACQVLMPMTLHTTLP